MSAVWNLCLGRLEDDLSSQQFNTWIRPLQAVEEGGDLKLLAPNQFVRDFIVKELLDEVVLLVNSFSKTPLELKVEVGSGITPPTVGLSGKVEKAGKRPGVGPVRFEGRLNPAFTFDSHIGGKSNQLARAAARQVGENPGKAYNPLFLYGGVGLGKTHLMQAAGNLVMDNQAKANVVYVHSERFVADMVRALQHNAINDFKRYEVGRDKSFIAVCLVEIG